MIITDKIKLYVLAGALGVGVLALAGAGMKIATLRVQLSNSQSETTTARGQLTARIAAESQAITAAVTKARAEEQAAAADLKEKFDDLKKQSAADAAGLRAARERLRILAASTTPGPDRGRDPEGARAADRVADASQDGPSAADRELIDALLQLAAESAESARQRNFVVNQYQVNCRRDAPR